MFRRERREHILRLLDETGHVEVDDLANRFGVGADSIRKDLQALAKEGKLKRVYGGAVSLREPAQADPRHRRSDGALAREPMLGMSGSPTNRTSRRKSRANAGHVRNEIGGPVTMGMTADAADDAGTRPIIDDVTTRAAVARRAYMEIHDGDTVFLDISRTNVLLADLIASGSKRLVVTTNMIDVLQRLSGLEHVTALATGGYLNVQLNGFVGSATVSLLEPLLFSKAFVGTSGIDLVNQAVTTNDIDSGSVKERVIHNASYRFLLADSGKFGMPGAFRFASLNDFSAIITDSDDPDVLVPLRRMGVPVLHTLDGSQHWWTSRKRDGREGRQANGAAFGQPDDGAIRGGAPA